MELWIRSQDKERLVKVYDIYIEGWLIRANFKEHYSGCNYVDLGEYNSKERALEVLDEIQNILQPIVTTHEPVIDYDDMLHSLSENVAIHCTQQIEAELKQAGQVVYQMPEN